jgi:hypothetical protein
MKKEIQSEKINRNMENIVAKFNNMVVSILSNVLDEEAISLVQSELEKNNEKFETIFSSKKIKKTKDLNAPKRAKTSYILFCVNKRDEVKESNPDMPAKEIIKELGNMWRSLSDDEKTEYVNLANEDKERYEEDMKTYVPVNNAGEPTKKTKKKKSSGPKKGLSAYIFFCKNVRDSIKKEQPTLSTKEITSALGKKWMSLSEEEKEPYVKLAVDDKSRFEEEKKNYSEGQTHTEVSKKPTKKEVEKPSKKEVEKPSKKKVEKPSKKKVEKPSKKEDKKASKKPSKKVSKKSSGFVLFCEEERPSLEDENPDLSSQQLVKQLTKSWNSLEEEERSDYNDRASSD